jgi:hypothetical protein
MGMKKIRNKRDLQMLRHKLRYKEKILEKEISDVSAELISDLNWNAKSLTFEMGSRLIVFLIQTLKKSKKRSKNRE